MKRTRRISWVFCGLIAIGAVSCGGSNPYVEPPVNTYTVAQFALLTGAFGDTVQGATVSPDFFPNSKARPLVGRFFEAGDYEHRDPRAVVISHELWRRRFNSEPTIIGTDVRLNGRGVTVVGIAPQDFLWPKDVEVWVPRPAK